MLQRGRGGNKERLTGVVKKGLRGREEEKSAHAADRSWRTGKENDGDLALWHAEPCGAGYSWNLSMGASRCWKMYCCWLRSTWGAILLSSSSVPK